MSASPAPGRRRRRPRRTTSSAKVRRITPPSPHMPASTATLLAGARVPATNGEVGPEEIIGRVERSGLRGRGGGGFPLARKLSAARANAAGGEAFAIANAYDADPDSPLSQTLLRRNPEAVLAGLALAARAIGARRAFLYIRPDAEAEPSWTSQREGLSIEVVRGTGGFMGGEETRSEERRVGKECSSRR